MATIKSKWTTCWSFFYPFLTLGSSSLFIAYLSSKRQSPNVLAWLLDRVQEDLAVEVKFKMYSMPVLLYELVRVEIKITNTVCLGLSPG